MGCVKKVQYKLIFGKRRVQTLFYMNKKAKFIRSPKFHLVVKMCVQMRKIYVQIGYE